MFVTTAVRETPSSAQARSQVNCSRLLPPASLMNGFGMDSRETGQSRVPEPPDRMTGRSCMLLFLSFTAEWFKLHLSPQWKFYPCPGMGLDGRPEPLVYAAFCSRERRETGAVDFNGDEKTVAPIALGRGSRALGRGRGAEKSHVQTSDYDGMRTADLGSLMPRRLSLG